MISCLYPGESIILRGRRHEFNYPLGRRVSRFMYATNWTSSLFFNYGNRYPRGVVGTPRWQCLRGIQILNLIMCFNIFPGSWTRLSLYISSSWNYFALFFSVVDIFKVTFHAKTFIRELITPKFVCNTTYQR